MKNWQKVYTTDKVYRATIIKDVLEENFLRPVLINKQDTIYKIGQVEIYVPPEEVLLAIKIIDEKNAPA